MAADGWLLVRFANRHLNQWTVVERTRGAPLSRGWRPGLQLTIGKWRRDTPAARAIRR